MPPPRPGCPRTETTALVVAYSDAQLDALRTGLAFLALFSLLALAYVRRLPDELILKAPAEVPA